MKGQDLEELNKDLQSLWETDLHICNVNTIFQERHSFVVREGQRLSV